MSLKYIQDGVPLHIAGGGAGGDAGIVISYEDYMQLSDKSGLYYVVGAPEEDGDVSGAIVSIDPEGDVPVLPTVTATQPAKIGAKETLSSLMTKITEVISNIRWLFANLGDIRKVKGGTVVEGGTNKDYPQVGLTVTDAIANLNNNLDNKGKVYELAIGNNTVPAGVYLCTITGQVNAAAAGGKWHITVGSFGQKVELIKSADKLENFEYASITGVITVLPDVQNIGLTEYSTPASIYGYLATAIRMQ